MLGKNVLSYGYGFFFFLSKVVIFPLSFPRNCSILNSDACQTDIQDLGHITQIQVNKMSTIYWLLRAT